MNGEEKYGGWGKKLKQLLEVNPMFAKNIFRMEDKVEKNVRGMTVTSNPALSTQASKASKIGSEPEAEGVAFEDFLGKASVDTTSGSFNPMKSNSELCTPMKNKNSKLPEPPENREHSASVRSRDSRNSGSSWVNEIMRRMSGVGYQQEEEQALCEKSWRSTVLLRLEVEAGSRPMDKLGSWLSLSVLFMIVIHPTVSTYTFQLFNCNKIYLDDDEPRWWLALDHATECYVGSWYSLRALAIFIMMSYVMGMPFLLAVICFSMYDMKRVEVMGRVEYVPSKFLRQELVPVEPKSESIESNGIASTLGIPDAEKKEEVTTNCTWDDSVASNSSATVDPLSHHEMLSPKATRLKTAKKNVKSNGRSLEHEVIYYVVQKTAGDGEIITAVTPLWREESNQVGVMQTGLQHPVFEALLGPHIVHFKPQLYYWGLCYEMLRRVAVTSVVILIQSTLEAPRYDVIYAQVVCVLALMMQAQIKPYSRSNINIMQTLFIGSQALVMLLLTTEKYVTETPFESDVCGWLLVVMQVALMIFVMYHVWREAAPLLAEQFTHMMPSNIERRSRLASGWSSYSLTDNL